MTQPATKIAATPVPEVADDQVQMTEIVIYSLVMATMLGAIALLFSELMTFSASLDALSNVSLSDSYILIARLAAGIVILLLLKEAGVALLAYRQMVLTATASTPELHAPARTGKTVSIIVPAYNEAETIERTLASLLKSSYPILDIVIVDDGSTDETLAKAQTAAARSTRVPVTVLTQANGGKWRALNRGIAASKGELVLCVDADSMIDADALSIMVPHFDDAGVAAVCGQVSVRNKRGLIARLQALEYVVANGSARTAQSGDGCVLIVPGPIGLFRRAILDQVRQTFFADGETWRGEVVTGPFSPHTFAEDFELSVMIGSIGGRVVYEPAAKARTMVPETLRELLSQRYRWIRGSMQVNARFHDLEWSSKGGSGALRRWMTIAGIGDLYVVPIAGLLLMATAVWALLLGEVASLLSLWILVWLIHASAAIMFIRSHGEDLSLALLSPLQSLYGAVILTGVWTHAFIDQVTGRAMKW